MRNMLHATRTALCALNGLWQGICACHLRYWATSYLGWVHYSVPRYSLRSCARLEAALSALQQASHLSKPVLVRMLLSMPELSAVPSSFWDLLLQYLLFLAPHWRKQVG